MLTNLATHYKLPVAGTRRYNATGSKASIVADKFIDVIFAGHHLTVVLYKSEPLARQLRPGFHSGSIEVRQKSMRTADRPVKLGAPKTRSFKSNPTWQATAALSEG